MSSPKTRPSAKKSAALPGPRTTHDLGSIVDVAVRVFLERGYDGTSMEQLAATARLTKSSLYHHVDGKEALLRLGISRALDAYTEMLAEPEVRRGTPAVRLRYVIRRTCELVARYVPEVALLVRVRGNTPTEKWAMARRRETNKMLETMIAEAMRPGTSASPDVMARLIFGMINSAVDWMRPGTMHAEPLIEAIEVLLFSGAFR